MDEQPGDGKRLYKNLFNTVNSELQYINTPFIKEFKDKDTLSNQDITVDDKTHNININNNATPPSFDDISTNNVVYLPDNYFRDDLGSDLNLFMKSFTNLKISHIPLIPIYGN
jgi:hypothetical protein